MTEGSFLTSEFFCCALNSNKGQGTNFCEFSHDFSTVAMVGASDMTKQLDCILHIEILQIHLENLLNLFVVEFHPPFYTASGGNMHRPSCLSPECNKQITKNSVGFHLLSFFTGQRSEFPSSTATLKGFLITTLATDLQHSTDPASGCHVNKTQCRFLTFRP